MAQHFLLTAAPRTLLLRRIMSAWSTDELPQGGAIFLTRSPHRTVPVPQLTL